MVELSPANLELGLELPLSKPSMAFPEAPSSLARPLDVGGTLGQVAEVSHPPVSLLIQHLDISCCHPMVMHQWSQYRCFHSPDSLIFFFCLSTYSLSVICL